LTLDSQNLKLKQEISYLRHAVIGDHITMHKGIDQNPNLEFLKEKEFLRVS